MASHSLSWCTARLLLLPGNPRLAVADGGSAAPQAFHLLLCQRPGRPSPEGTLGFIASISKVCGIMHCVAEAHKLHCSAERLSAAVA